MIVQLTPTAAWLALSREERLRWVEDRFAQLAESFADDESGPLWSQITEMHTTRGIERSVVMLWPPTELATSTPSSDIGADPISIQSANAKIAAMAMNGEPYFARGLSNGSYQGWFCEDGSGRVAACGGADCVARTGMRMG